MTYDQVDLDLFRIIRRTLHRRVACRNKLTAYSQDAKIIWVGKNYMMVRSGHHRHGRDVTLWNRNALLLERGNPYRNAMTELALATIDPINRDWSSNKSLLLHNSKGGGGLPEFHRKRWSKSLLAALIAHAQEEDHAFSKDEAERRAERMAQHAFSARVVGLAEEAGLNVTGPRGGEEIPRPADKRYTIYLNPNCRYSEEIRFTPRADGSIILSGGATLDEEEFEVVVDALRQVYKARVKAKELAQLERSMT